MTDASYHHSQRYTVDFTAEGIYTVHHTTQRLQMHCVTWPITCTARRDPSHALCTAWRDPSHALRDVTHHIAFTDGNWHHEMLQVTLHTQTEKCFKDVNTTMAIQTAKSQNLNVVCEKTRKGRQRAYKLQPAISTPWNT